MDVTHINQSGFTWNIRVPKCFQDEHVVFEVVTCDCYHLQDIGPLYKPEVILDIGGHIGTFGVYAKSFWPDAKLVVVEPCAENLELYKLNAKSNGLKNVRFIHGAIGYDPDRTCLVNSPTSTGGHLLLNRKQADEYTDKQYRFYNVIQDDAVKIYTVEDIVGDYQYIDFAKWDCEGGEVEAFKQMRDDTALKFKFMCGEYHIWSEKSDYLKPDLFECIKFWRDVRRKFPHLNFTYKENPLGPFQAWPKIKNEVTMAGVRV